MQKILEYNVTSASFEELARKLNVRPKRGLLLYMPSGPEIVKSEHYRNDMAWWTLSEAASSSSQNIFRRLWNQNVHYLLKCPTLDTVLRQMKPVHIITSQKIATLFSCVRLNLQAPSSLQVFYLKWCMHISLTCLLHDY